MAVYCPEYRLLFIGNNRTASTAVGHSLVAKCGGHYLPSRRFRVDGEIISKRHATLHQLVRHELLDAPPDTLLKFSAVRNPYDSLVSLWLKLRHRPRYADSKAAREGQDFPTFVFDRFGRKPPGSMHTRWVEGVDIIMRFETLAADLAAVLERAGAPRFELSVVNPTEVKTRSYREYYDERTRAFVAQHFAEDLERYGYEF